ncbi:hypothetical protein SLA2020_339940 [Shorea laevis]
MGIKGYSSVEEVEAAYEKLSSKWNSGNEVPSTSDFIKIRYAYELLTNPLWKRNYDIFGIDEHLDVIEKVKAQYAGESFSKVELPLLDDTGSDPEDFTLNVITSNDFQSILQNTEPWLIQLFSFGSKRCAQFSDVWKRIVMYALPTWCRGRIPSSLLPCLGPYHLVSAANSLFTITLS